MTAETEFMSPSAGRENPEGDGLVMASRNVIGPATFTFACRLTPKPDGARFVTGPGRSGAIASAILSHQWGVAFLPFGQYVEAPCVVVVDTIEQSGATLRAAAKRYPNCIGTVAVMGRDPSRHRFWYEERACESHPKRISF